MALNKTIICLTDSMKHQNHCIAGRELIKTQIGEWIRPISELELGELTPLHFRMKGGGSLHMLDIVNIPLIKRDVRTTIPHQTENYLVDAQTPWEKVGQFPKVELPRLVDVVDTLWINGDRPGMNDRISAEEIRRNVHSSLVLVKPESLTLISSLEFGKRRLTAAFRLKGADYRLRVTDLTISSVFSNKSFGEYPIQGAVYLCISLGEIYKGYCYKLVASILSS